MHLKKKKKKPENLDQTTLHMYEHKIKKTSSNQLVSLLLVLLNNAFLKNFCLYGLF